MSPALGPFATHASMSGFPFCTYLRRFCALCFDQVDAHNVVPVWTTSDKQVNAVPATTFLLIDIFLPGGLGDCFRQGTGRRTHPIHVDGGDHVIQQQSGYRHAADTTITAMTMAATRPIPEY